jgi:hypothetical protein
MRKKLLFALVIALLTTLIVAAPAFAWTSVYGQCIDSATLQGWAYGGTVTIYGDVSVGAIASGPLAGDGTFNIPLPPEPLPDNTLYIVITYTAGPQGAPGTYIETIPDIPTGTGYNLGYVHTDTGPNAVTLADVNAQSPSQWFLAALAAVALVGVGGAVLLFRRRRVA